MKDTQTLTVQFSKKEILGGLIIEAGWAKNLTPSDIMRILNHFEGKNLDFQDLRTVFDSSRVYPNIDEFLKYTFGTFLDYFRKPIGTAVKKLQRGDCSAMRNIINKLTRKNKKDILGIEQYDDGSVLYIQRKKH